MASAKWPPERDDAFPLHGLSTDRHMLHPSLTRGQFLQEPLFHTIGDGFDKIHSFRTGRNWSDPVRGNRPSFPCIRPSQFERTILMSVRMRDDRASV